MQEDLSGVLTGVLYTLMIEDVRTTKVSGLTYYPPSHRETVLGSHPATFV